MRIYKILFMVAFFTSISVAGDVLTIGDTAPEFKLKDNSGRLHSLLDYKGKIVALYFYPKDNTRGCTEQACNLRDNFSALSDSGVIILGVSYDDSVSHAAFSEKYQLPFPLLSDTDKSVAKAYGAYKGENSNPARITAIIDKDGKILNIITDVQTGKHSDQILSAIKN